MADAESPLTSLIRRRRMTRSFTGGPEVDRVVGWCATALRAPTAGFAQGVHMIVLSGDSLAEFWDVSGAGSWFAGVNEGVLAAPVVVVVGGRIGPYLERYGSPDKAGHGLEVESGWPVPFWLTDAAMAAQNLLLLVEEARLGALFFGLFRNVDAVARRLGAPDDFRPVGAIAIGGRSDSDRPSGSPGRRPRLADGELVHLGTW